MSRWRQPRLAQHPAAAGAQDQALLDQVGLDHVLQRVARLGQRGGEGFDADRAAGVVFGDAAEIAAVHRVEAEAVHLQAGQRGVGDRRGRPGRRRPPRRSRAPGAAGGRRCAACRGSGGRSPRRPRGVRVMPSFSAPRATISSQFLGRVEDQAQRDAEAVAQRGGEQAGAGGGADQGEGRQVDADGAGGRALADDEVELEVLHRRVEDFLDGRLQAVDLVDEQHVAGLQVGQDGGQVAGALDDRAGGGAEADAEFAGDDLGQGGLAEARRAVQQHVVQRLAAGAGGLDEDGEVLPAGALADEFGQRLRAQAGLGRVVLAAGRGRRCGRRSRRRPWGQFLQAVADHRVDRRRLTEAREARGPPPAGLRRR